MWYLECDLGLPTNEHQDMLGIIGTSVLSNLHWAPFRTRWDVLLFMETCTLDKEINSMLSTECGRVYVFSPGFLNSNHSLSSSCQRAISVCVCVSQSRCIPKLVLFPFYPPTFDEVVFVQNLTHNAKKPPRFCFALLF